MEKTVMKRFRPGCYAVVTCQGKAVVTKKTRWPFTGQYDLPGGGMEHGENHLDTVIRELNEEIGLKVGADDLRMVGIFHHVVEFEKNGETVSQHLLAIAYQAEIDSEAFADIVSWATVGSETDSDAGERAVVERGDFESLSLTPICRKALGEVWTLR